MKTIKKFLLEALDSKRGSVYRVIVCDENMSNYILASINYGGIPKEIMKQIEDLISSKKLDVIYIGTTKKNLLKTEYGKIIDTFFDDDKKDSKKGAVLISLDDNKTIEKSKIPIETIENANSNYDHTVFLKNLTESQYKLDKVNIINSLSDVEHKLSTDLLC